MSAHPIRVLPRLPRATIAGCFFALAALLLLSGNSGCKSGKDSDQEEPPESVSDTFGSHGELIARVGENGPEIEFFIEGPTTVVRHEISPNVWSTEIVNAELHGMLNLGPMGQSEATIRIGTDIEGGPAKATIGRADLNTGQAYFDVFFTLELGGQILHNDEPVRMQAEEVWELPPYLKRYRALIPVRQLLREDGSPSGIYVMDESAHIPQKCYVDLDIQGTRELNEESLGGHMCLNDDDDDRSDFEDRLEAPVAGEDDLIRLILRDAQPRPDGATVTLSLEQGAGRVQVWRDPTKIVPVGLPAVFDVASLPLTLWVEGIVPSTQSQDIEFKLEYVFDNERCEDRVRATVVRFDLDVNGDKDLADNFDLATNYLPGYGPKPATPGELEPKVSTGTTFNAPNYVGQEMKLVVEPIGLTSGIDDLLFEIRETSRYEGFCENATHPTVTGGPRDDDYSFKGSEDEIERTITPATTEAQGGKMENDRTWAKFWCKDYGGRCEVRVSLRINGTVIASCDRVIPRDIDEDDIADRWEREKVDDWNTQYGANEVIGTAFFAREDDRELADPDGAGALVAQRAIADHLTFFVEYRSFILDGGGHDGAGANDHAGGHVRLSPARKEGLLEVDHRAALAHVPAGGVGDYLDVCAQVWSQAARGAGVYVYYLLDHVALPAPNFLAGDTVAQAVMKQRAYLLAHRGSAGAAAFINVALLRSTTHVVFLSDVPAVHRFSAGFTYSEAQTGVRGERGCYLLTSVLNTWAGQVSTAANPITATVFGGVTAAHEYGHMVIRPATPTAVWDAGEHLIGNPGNTALMGDATVNANSDQAQVTITAATQAQVDLAGNPALTP